MLAPEVAPTQAPASTRAPLLASTPRPAIPAAAPRPTATPLPAPTVLESWDSSLFAPHQNPETRFNLSGLDAAATKAEIVRLLNDGWVMYYRLSRFSRRLPDFMPPFEIYGPLAVFERFRFSYPETIIEDFWIRNGPDESWFVYSESSTVEGTLLAMPVRVSDSIPLVDAETGTVLLETSPLSGPRDGEELTLFDLVDSKFRIIEELIELGRTSTPGEYLGRLSANFSTAVSESEDEYQIANPYLFRSTNRQKDDDGNWYVQSDRRAIDFAMLPPGSMPEIPFWPPGT